MNSPIPNKKQLSLFYSYAHEDEKFRVELGNHLSTLERLNIISGWHDRKLYAGTEFVGGINDQLEKSDIILLLISSDFIASDFCWGIEMARALERHNNGEARVIPIIVRAADWRGAPFGSLTCLPTDGKPVTSWMNIDEAWTDVAIGVRKVAEAIVNGEIIIDPPDRPSFLPGQI